MGVVCPIKDWQALERMKDYLRERNFRNYLLFRIGVNLGLPVQDLLKLRVEDLLGKKVFGAGDCQIEIGESLQEEIKRYVEGRTSGYLFLSVQGKPLSRFQLYGILKNTADAVGFSEPVGAMTLRKTFAYWAYKNRQIYLPLLSKYLNHHTVQHTLRYIDIDEGEKAKSDIFLSAMDL